MLISFKHISPFRLAEDAFKNKLSGHINLYLLLSCTLKVTFVVFADVFEEVHIFAVICVMFSALYLKHYVILKIEINGND